MVKLVTEIAMRENPANTQLGGDTSCVKLVSVRTCSVAICSVETCGVAICGVGIPFHRKKQ
jgi:hypothetical protein